MADHAWLYYIRIDSLLHHLVSVTAERRRIRLSLFRSVTMLHYHVQPASETDPDAVPFLQWAARTLAQEDPETDGERLVAQYLFRHRPGMRWVADFRGEYFLVEDLLWLTQNNHQVRERLGLSGRTHLSVADEPGAPVWEALFDQQLQEASHRRAQFLTRFPHPLAALNLSGWTLLDRQDMAALRESYRRYASEQLHFAPEWAAAFNTHDNERYDIATLIYTSEARL